MRYRKINCALNEFDASIRLLAPSGDNSIDEDTAHELRDCCSRLGLNNEIRVVTITGGGGVFAVGRQGAPDVIVDAPIARRLDWIVEMSVANAFASLPMPTIAILNGDATGHGLELAMAADLRIAVDTASLSIGSVQDYGFPYDGGTQRLPRLVGPGLAREMLFTGRVLTAQEALEIGLVNRVESPKNLGQASSDLANRIAATAPIASRYAKEAVTASGDLTLSQGLRLEADLSVILQSTEDRAEGLQSFAEKRYPRFEGR
jgi:enoyl-CoA hydratase